MGTVWFGFSVNGQLSSERQCFEGDHAEVRADRGPRAAAVGAAGRRMTAPADASLVDSPPGLAAAAGDAGAHDGAGASGTSIMVPVVLPAVQADFGVARADASLPYTLLMIGFGVGGLFMGRLADPLWCGGAAGPGRGRPGPWAFSPALSHNIWWFCGGARPADRPVRQLGNVLALAGRHLAVVHAAARHCGGHLRQRQLLGGAVRPPIVQHFVEAWAGARLTWAWPCSAASRCWRWRSSRCASGPGAGRAAAMASGQPAGSLPFGLKPGTALALLSVAGVSCCVAMSMPQVHIVAYCADLGYGAARGAEMLSLMLACGIVSRLISGAICDRIGGLRTLLPGLGPADGGAGDVLPFDGLVPL